jgi:hypothetical protein
MWNAINDEEFLDVKATVKRGRELQPLTHVCPPTLIDSHTVSLTLIDLELVQI